jgi:hypothetical protein
LVLALLFLRSWLLRNEAAGRDGAANAIV